MGKYSAIVLILGGYMQYAGASRTTHPPAIRFHDWAQTAPGLSPPTPAWCTPSGPGIRGYQKGVEITITNGSSIKQTVTVTVKPSGVNSSSLASPSQKLGTNWQYNAKVYSLGTAVPGTPFVIQPGESQIISAYINFFGPAPAGDWHMVGTLDVQFDVLEDRGAISASIETNLENNCATFDNTQVIGMLRNISKVYTVNGGRYF